MRKRPLPSVVVACVALFLSLTGAAFGAEGGEGWRTVRVHHPVRRAAMTYITSSVTDHQHVGRCRRIRPRENLCDVRFRDWDSFTLDGEPIYANFTATVFVRRPVVGFVCTFDPTLFAWEPC